ncbi:MAG: hypothetical protein KBT34_07095 [Prevotella sp.]|nr:hypothetical protein [Candidatus Prevotella equi]
MKKVFSIIAVCLATMSANAQEQLANSDFEQWESVSYSGRTGEEPVMWSSFLDGTGKLKSMAGYIQLAKSTDVRPGTTGQYSAVINSREVKMGMVTLATAQGNLTNGCVNMGSTSATDASGNYNYINYEREDQAMKFTSRPKSLKVWMKGSCQYNASIAVHLLTNGYYQDPVSAKNPITATKVATASKSIAVTDKWTEYEVDFVYEEGVEANPEYILVTFASSATPGKANVNDKLYIDDLVMVYDNPVLPGDADNNGVVEMNDAKVTVDKFLGKDVEINEEAADMNEDKVITVSDANAIINTIVK